MKITSLVLSSVLVLAFAGRVAHADVAINDSSQTLTIDCAKDAEISINGSANTLTLVGPCKKVAVNGSACTLTIKSVVKLAVNGSGNSLDVNAVDKIAVTGTDNKVTYKRPVKAKRTKVANVGRDNSIKRVK